MVDFVQIKVALVNMSSKDVNMLIEMGFPRNKAYVYSLQQEIYLK